MFEAFIALRQHFGNSVMTNLGTYAKMTQELINLASDEGEITTVSDSHPEFNMSIKLENDAKPCPDIDVLKDQTTGSNMTSNEVENGYASDGSKEESSEGDHYSVSGANSPTYHTAAGEYEHEYLAEWPYELCYEKFDIEVCKFLRLPLYA